MDKKGLTHLIQAIVTLKEKLMCAICLDVMQDVVELDCSHKFCNECYSQYKSTEKQATCPLCKKVLKRRTTTYNDPFANSLGKFICETCNDVKKIYNCEVEQLHKALNEEKKPVPKDDTPNSKTSSLLPTSKTLKNKNTKIETFNDLLKVDAFDRLMNAAEKTPKFNKNGTRQVYVNKKKMRKEFEIKYDNLQFDNYENKVAVLKWLNDGRNKFDRLTQTQNIRSEKESELPSSTDIISISQVREELGGPSVSKHPRKERAKSLDIEIKKVPIRQNRFSEGEKTEVIENYDIEEVNTEEEEVVKKVEEKVLLDIIENEFLDKLESEMQEPQLKPKREVKNSTADASKGWERITKMKKTIKKSEKVPKQLNVTLQSTQGTKNEKEVKKLNSRPADITTGWTKNSDDKIRMASSKRRLKIVLQNIDISKLDKNDNKDAGELSKGKTSKCRHHEDIDVEKGKSYDLNELEDYIANNLKIIENNASLDSISSPLLNKRDNKKKQTDIIETSKEINDVISVNDLNVSLERDKKLNCALIKEIDEILLDESSQKQAHTVNREIEGNKQEDEEDDEPYDTPTQKLVHTCNNAHHSSDETFQTRTDFLNIFETTLKICLKNLNRANLAVIEDQLLTMQLQISNLKSPIVCDALTQTNLETINVKIQTEVKVDTTGIQTVVNNESIAVQTEDLCCPKCDFCVVGRETSLPSGKSGDDQTVQKPKSQLQNEIFTAIFDDLNFETQEVVRNQGIILRSTQKQVHDSQHQSRVCHSQKTQHLPASVLVCSLDNTTVSKKGTQKRYKRIRMPLGSDSDEENLPKKVCNKFIRDDLTIEFQTNTGAVSAETQNSEVINYDDYLAQVMKKYEDNVFPIPSLREKSKVSQPGKTVIKEIVSKCEEMLGQANKNVQHIKELAELSSSSKESFQTASQNLNDCNEIFSADNLFMDENNLLKLEKDIQDYERDSVKQQDTESTDVIVGTEEIEPLSKNVKKTDNGSHKPESASLFGKSNYNTLQRTDNSNKVCSELNDSFDEAKLEDIDVCEEQNSVIKPPTKIYIIDNVLIRSPNKDRNQEKEEDLFSDEDIVQPTPQKPISRILERSSVSQINNITNEKLPNPLSETGHFDYEFTALPPPPDFQDDLQAQNNLNDDLNCEPTVVDPDVTMTLSPNEFAQFIGNNKIPKELNQSQVLSPYIMPFNKTKVETNSLPPERSQIKELREERRIPHSTPVTQRDTIRETLEFSPIPVEDKTRSIRSSPRQEKQNGIVEMAQAANLTPLSFISKATPQKQNILTSMPKQKSIWNYVKPSQSSEMEVTSTTEVCIACTRLSKEQVAVISQMTKKKLATYSSSFHPGVTHMIVAVNQRNCLKEYTAKFVLAVAAGIWVLRFEWIEECLKRHCVVPEEPYEVLDISGQPGPRTSRLTRKTNPLFRGYKFYCAEPFSSTTKEDVEGIIKMLGGRVLKDLDELLENDGDVCLIVGEAHKTQDFDQYERWVEQYKVVTVDIVWLINCVGQYSVISIRPYMWCSEDHLSELNYPPQLMKFEPFSCTENF